MQPAYYDSECVTHLVIWRSLHVHVPGNQVVWRGGFWQLEGCAVGFYIQ